MSGTTLATGTHLQQGFNFAWATTAAQAQAGYQDPTFIGDTIATQLYTYGYFNPLNVVVNPPTFFSSGYLYVDGITLMDWPTAGDMAQAVESAILDSGVPIALQRIDATTIQSTPADRTDAAQPGVVGTPVAIAGSIYAAPEAQPAIVQQPGTPATLPEATPQGQPAQLPAAGGGSPPGANPNPNNPCGDGYYDASWLHGLLGLNCVPVPKKQQCDLSTMSLSDYISCSLGGVASGALLGEILLIGALIAVIVVVKK
jgi:hypothetical protein